MHSGSGRNIALLHFYEMLELADAEAIEHLAMRRRLVIGEDEVRKE
jgi:hypothetical protein